MYTHRKHIEITTQSERDFNALLTRVKGESAHEYTYSTK